MTAAPGPAETDRFATALRWAAELHRGSSRKRLVVGAGAGEPVPFISHPLAVASLVWEFGGDEDEAIAALLHDALEDVGPPMVDGEQVERRFGARVRRIVEECSDTTAPAEKGPWMERKRNHLSHLGEVGADALMVVACDKLHNVRTLVVSERALGSRVWDRFAAPPAEVCWYYRQVASVVADRLPGALAAELARAVDDLDVVVERAALRSPQAV